MQLLRKISPRTVYGSRADLTELVFTDKQKIHILYRVIGICTGTRTGENDETGKPWKALLGQFQAESFRNGEVFQSGVAFLPGYVTDIVAGKLNDDVTAVRFGFDINVAFDEASATSYTYGAVPLMEPAEDDPLAKLVKDLTPQKQIAGKK